MKSRFWRGANRGATILLLAPFVFLLASPAQAELEQVDDRLARGGRGDGVYGRFDGDLSLSAGLGCGYDGSPRDMRLGASLTTEFYQSLGVYGAVWQALPSDSPVPRTLELGVTLKPVFLLRWSGDAEWGRPFWDLLVDSIGLSMGVTLAEPAGGNLGVQNGIAVALGAGVPLLRQAPGPWLRMRGGIHSAGPEVTGTAQLLLEWQWFFFAGLLD